MVASAVSGERSLQACAVALGCERGVGGYVYHSVPMVLAALLAPGAIGAQRLEELYRLGGDADTTGAMLAPLLALRDGLEAFPPEWLTGIHNGPLSIAVLERAAGALASHGQRPVAWWWPLVPVRNLVFLLIVLAHGFRRLLP